MAKNYYQILGISGTANPAEIKAAFRRHAKLLHPDRSRRGSGPFLEVREAHDILVDPARRAAYDRELARRRESGFAARPTAEPFAAPQYGRARPPAEPFRQRQYRPTRLDAEEDLFERLWRI